MATKKTIAIPDSLKEAARKACNALALYQRLLESKGKAAEATEVKAIKDKLWEECKKE